MDPRSESTHGAHQKRNGRDRQKILPKTEKEAWFSHRFFFFIYIKMEGEKIVSSNL